MVGTSTRSLVGDSTPIFSGPPQRPVDGPFTRELPSQRPISLFARPLSSQTSPVFTYYSYVGTTLTPLSIQNPVPACALNEIAAIGIHVTFLAGPQIPTEGYAADEPTTLDTIVYLRGSSTAATSTTTTTSTLVACPE